MHRVSVSACSYETCAGACGRIAEAMSENVVVQFDQFSYQHRQWSGDGGGGRGGGAAPNVGCPEVLL